MAVRSFAAVSVGPAVEQAIGAAVKVLQRGMRDTRWVRPENAHLTLQFYGDVEEAALPALAAALAQAARGVPPFRIALAGAGAFPSVSRARVLWVGVEDPERGLARLAEAVREASEALGYRADHPFTPHLTVGRAKRQVIFSAAEALAHLAGPFGEAHIDELLLLQSELGPQGSHYFDLGRFPLGS